MARSAWPARTGLALLATVPMGALAAPAQAASIGVASVSGTEVQFEAASGKQNKVVVTRAANTITIDDSVAVRAGNGCKAVKGAKTRPATCGIPPSALVAAEPAYGERWLSRQ